MRPQNVMASICRWHRHGFAGLLGTFCAICDLQPTEGKREPLAAVHGPRRKLRIIFHYPRLLLCRKNYWP